MPRRYLTLSNLDRARALGQLHAGHSGRRFVMAFNTSRKSIGRIRQRYAASGCVKDLLCLGNLGRQAVPRIDLSTIPRLE